MLKTFTEHPRTQSILQHIVMGGLSLCLVCICYFVLFIDDVCKMILSVYNNIFTKYIFLPEGTLGIRYLFAAV